MKYLKKITGMVLVLAMVLAMAGTALADKTDTGNNEGDSTITGTTPAATGSITVENAVKDQTYTIYKIFDLEGSNLEQGAYVYTVAKDWNGFFEDEGAVGANYVIVDEDGHVRWNTDKSLDSDVADFAKAALAYAKKNNIPNIKSETVSDDGELTFSNLDLGYYLLDSSLGTLCSLNTTNPDVTIQEKNSEPGNMKTVKEGEKYDSVNDAQIGDTVEFQSTITARAGAENYVFHDVMSEGLTFSGVESVTVVLRRKGSVNSEKVESTDENNENYTIKTDNLDDKCTFEVVFTQDFCNKLEENDEIVISYSATLNEKAAVAGDGNKNTSMLKYGENGDAETNPSETKTYTWEISVFKYTKETTDDSATSTQKGLAGAKFTINKENEDVLTLVKITDETDGETGTSGAASYRVAVEDETDTITEITTDDTGKFSIQGLDSGTYYLTETKAPNGYTKLAGPVKVVIETTEDNKGLSSTVTYWNYVAGQSDYGSEGMEANGGEIEIINNTGTELPSTGGTGTTIFYIIGGILVVGAAVLLIAKRRMNNEES